MGKYMRKGKAVGGMEVSQSSLGVRTRARALAIEKDRKLSVARTTGSFKPQSSHCENEPAYLELRSRKLEKVTCPRDEGSHARKTVSECRPSQVGNSEMYDDSSSRLVLSEEARQSLSQLISSAASEGRRASLALQAAFKASPASSIYRPSSAAAAAAAAQRDAVTSRSNSVTMSQDRPGGILTRNKRRQEKRMMGPDDMDVDMEILAGPHQAGVGASVNNSRNMEVEASFDENAMDHGGLSTKDSQMSGRRVRESTPSSYVRETEAPGSSSRLSYGRRRIPTRSASAPPAGRLPETEIEDFFRGAEQQERQRFTERYNFDPVNDRPLPGRYEWVSLQQQQQQDKHR